MRFHVLTLFPGMVETVLGESILGRASQKGLVEFSAVDIRSYTENRHNRVDDYTYGGGAGMLMQAQPVLIVVRMFRRRSQSGWADLPVSSICRRLDLSLTSRWQRNSHRKRS